MQNWADVLGNEIDSAYEKFRMLLTSGNIINLENIEMRKKYLFEMESIHKVLFRTLASVTDKLANAKEQHLAEISKIDKALDGLKKMNDIEPEIKFAKIVPEEDHAAPSTPNGSVSWSKIVASKNNPVPQQDQKPIVAHTQRQENEEKTFPPNTPGILRVTPPAKQVSFAPGTKQATLPTVQNHLMRNTLTKVFVSERLYINAYIVAAWDHVLPDGRLYYVEPSKHFAIKIGDLLLHGNIGNIFSPGNEITRVKDCWYGKECNKEECQYYHDPIYYPGKTDVRNYVGWSYSPPTSMDKSTNTHRFGSRNYLEADITKLTRDEVNRFYDHAMHELLCAMLLWTCYVVRN